MNGLMAKQHSMKRSYVILVSVVVIFACALQPSFNSHLLEITKQETLMKSKLLKSYLRSKMLQIHMMLKDYILYIHRRPLFKLQPKGEVLSGRYLAGRNGSQ
jgi:hypothetical protein